jgi:hypothetical protein
LNPKSTSNYLTNALHNPLHNGLDRDGRRKFGTSTHEILYFDDKKGQYLNKRQIIATTKKGEIKFLNLPELPNENNYRKVRDLANVELDDKTQNDTQNDFENDLNKSCVKGRVGVIFSISMAMACASNMPIMIGKRRSPLASVRIKVNDPACNWLGDRSNISSFILSTVQI